MQITSLKLKDFRGFEQLEFSLTAPFSVLLGTNGAGKSSILDALAMLLEPAVHELRRGAGLEGMRQDDWPAPISELRAGAKAPRPELYLAIKSQGQAFSWRLGTDLTTQDNGLRDYLDGDQPSHPTIVYYPASRSVANRSTGESESLEEYLDNPYMDSLYGLPYDGAPDFSTFVRWFRQREDIENEAIRSDRSHIDPMLNAVRVAICTFLPQFSNPRIIRSRAHGERTGLFVDKQGTPLSLDQLSSGERLMLAMVGDLARRLVLANPEADSPLTGQGVVLIDEPELHLHPNWQRGLLHGLAKTFPGLQFIVATQSPIITSDVMPAQVFVLQDFRLRQPPHTRGRDANAILQEVMGLPRFAPTIDRRIDAIDDAIELAQWAEAREMLDTLALDFGETDPEIVRLRMLLETLAA